MHQLTPQTDEQTSRTVIDLRPYGPKDKRWTSIVRINDDGSEDVLGIGDLEGIKNHPILFGDPSGEPLFAMHARNLGLAATAAIEITDPTGASLAEFRQDNARTVLFRTTINVNGHRHRIQLVEQNVAFAIIRRLWATTVEFFLLPIFWLRARFSFVITVDGQPSGTITLTKNNSYRMTFDHRIDWRVASMFGVVVDTFINR